MTTISVYSYDAEEIKKVCDDNDMSEHELIELLLEHLSDVKEEYNLK